MTRAILDTNVLVQGVISAPPSASVAVLDAYYEGRYLLVCSPATLDELIEVMLIPHISRRHGMSDDEVLEFAASLQANAERYPGSVDVLPSIPRDVTDIKLLGLAMESGADYLVTNDHRHMLRLREFGRTRIVTPTEFLRCLSQS